MPAPTLDAALEQCRLQVRWDALVSALQEVRAEAFHARDEARAAREEARNAQDEVRQLQEAGCKLQEAYENLQRELRDAVGDAAYWKVLVEEGEREPRDPGNRCEKATGDWTALRADAQSQAAEAARAEAARWRQLAERRGEELLRLRQQLSAKEAKGVAAPGMPRTLQASEQVKRASQHPALEVPTPARAQARRGQASHPARGSNAEETCNSSNSHTEYFHIGSPTTQRALSAASGPKSARVHRAKPGAQSNTAVASTGAAAAAAASTRKAAGVQRQASQPSVRRPLSTR